MTFRIEHALVMDTDHLRGGGGYSVAAVSPGVSEAERVFVAENFGISDFLHDPHNDRVYFSVFRIPGGRMAFVRRFANGTRRNGVQSRLFVHTLLLEETLLERLIYLPWLLIDRPLMMGGDEIFLSNDPEPLLHGGSFTALEWNGTIAASDAFEQLALRYDQLGKRFRQSEELAAFDPAGVIAASLDRISRGQRVKLPQGSLYEQLSLLIWSLMPPADRMELAWTQHESANTAIAFPVANEPSPDDAIDFAAVDSPSSRQLVASSTASAEEWSGMQATMMLYGISLRTRDVEAWLGWSNALQDVLKNPSADESVLISRLETLARAVRGGRSDRWVNENEVLGFLLALISRARKPDETELQATARLSAVFERSGIANVVFRVAPPAALLDEHERKLGAAALVDCFLRGTERVEHTEATRAAVAAWLLDSGRADRVELPILGRLVERLAADRSEYVKPLLEKIVARPGGLRELAEVLPPQKPAIGDAVLMAVMLGIERRNPDTASFIGQQLLPQLNASKTLARRISAEQAQSIGAALRQAPESFAAFAAQMPAAAAASLVASVEDWMLRDRRGTAALARAVLMAANRGELGGVSVEELAFMAAEGGEATTLWLPAALDGAGRLDQSGDSRAVQDFLARVARLGRQPARANADALRQVVSALRQRVSQGARAGVCTRELIRFTRPWPDPGSLAAALQAALAAGSCRAPEWSSVVAELVQAPPSNGYLTAAAGGLLLTYWDRLGAAEFGGVAPELIDSLPGLTVDARERVVARWLPLLRSLPEGGSAERFIGTLASIAPDRLIPQIEVEQSLREIDHDAGDAETLARLDAALRACRKPPDQPVRLAIAKITDRMPDFAGRAAWLVGVTAAPMTPPSTRRIIEHHFLAKVLARLGPHEWSPFLSAAGDDIFAHGLVLLTVAEKLVLLKADEQARRSFQRRCSDRGRDDALAVMASPSRGFLESVSDLFRGETH